MRIWNHKLGIWIRDNVQGLGTITFLTGNSKFGALGHGIHDADTSVLMDIGGGSLYKTSIRSILKGENGMGRGDDRVQPLQPSGDCRKKIRKWEFMGRSKKLTLYLRNRFPFRWRKKRKSIREMRTIRCCLGEEVREYGIHDHGGGSQCERGK